MKNKILISMAACMLFVLAGFSAFAGERVYIRLITFDGKSQALIYEKGEVQNISVATPYKKEEALKSMADILEKYFQQGYKLLSTTGIGGSYCVEYIFEKP
jgi:hypothetical protein